MFSSDDEFGKSNSMLTYNEFDKSNFLSGGEFDKSSLSPSNGEIGQSGLLSSGDVGKSNLLSWSQFFENIPPVDRKTKTNTGMIAGIVAGIIALIAIISLIIALILYKRKKKESSPLPLQEETKSASNGKQDSNISVSPDSSDRDMNFWI